MNLGRFLPVVFWMAALIPGAAAPGPNPEVPGVGAQIAGALAAAPEDRRAGAAVMGYTKAGELTALRQGSNEILCLADKPGDGRFHVACYHRSLEPFMARGRELRSEGIDGPDNLVVRHQEADDGKLELPSGPATLYVLGGPVEIFDPKTGAVDGGHWVWSIYMPYATKESTGLPTTPQAPGGPWIMRGGSASSHLMIVQPREAPAPADE